MQHCSIFDHHLQPCWACCRSRQWWGRRSPSSPPSCSAPCWPSQPCNIVITIVIVWSFIIIRIIMIVTWSHRSSEQGWFSKSQQLVRLPRHPEARNQTCGCKSSSAWIWPLWPCGSHSMSGASELFVFEPSILLPTLCDNLVCFIFK